MVVVDEGESEAEPVALIPDAFVTSRNVPSVWLCKSSTLPAALSPGRLRRHCRNPRRASHSNAVRIEPLAVTSANLPSPRL